LARAKVAAPSCAFSDLFVVKRKPQQVFVCFTPGQKLRVIATVKLGGEGLNL
jgi:hypothetical protein